MENIKLYIGIAITFVIIILVLALSPFTIISAGERGVVLNWGAVSDTVFSEGIHWVTPIAQDVKKIDVKIQKEEVEASAASKDLQTVSAVIALNYHPNPDQVNLLWQKVGKEYKTRVIDPAIQEAVKASTAKYTAEELITKRQEVKDDIKVILSERLTREFIVVDEVSIVSFDFSRSFNEAIEAKVTAEQSALAAKNKLEQIKFEAEQRVTTAKGEAEAIRIQAQAITQQGGEDYVRLKWVEKWNGVLPSTMLGENTPIVSIK